MDTHEPDQCREKAPGGVRYVEQLPSGDAHIVAKALSLTELCRASLEHSAGWYHRTDLHGNGVWFHPASKQFSRGPPEAVRRIKSMMPSEWVDNCAKDVLKMLRQGATERVGIPREW